MTIGMTAPNGAWIALDAVAIVYPIDAHLASGDYASPLRIGFKGGGDLFVYALTPEASIRNAQFREQLISALGY